MALALALIATALIASSAQAGTLWPEDWSTHTLDKWYTHTYNPPERPLGEDGPLDSYSFGGTPGDEYLDMVGNSWGIETRQAFNIDAPISVEAMVKVQPVGSSAASTQYFAGITIYNGESGYEEIALQDNPVVNIDDPTDTTSNPCYDPANSCHDPNGLQIVSVASDSTIVLPNNPSYGNGQNLKLPRDQFYKLRLDYDGHGNWSYYVNDALVLVRSGAPLSSNADIFLLSVANNSHGWNVADYKSKVETQFKTVNVRANYNLFSNTTWVNFMNQDNTQVDTAGEDCTFNQCDFLQLKDNGMPPFSVHYGNDQGLGHTDSPQVNLVAGKRWGEVLTTTILNGQDFTVQVLKPDGALVPEQYLPGNAAGFRGSSVNLSGLDPDQFTSLKLRANFQSYGPYYNQTPRLYDWSLTFGNRSYFSWYDQFSPGFRDWVLASHPGNFGGEAHFFAELGSPVTDSAYITAAHGKAAYASWPGKIGGPVTVNNLTGLPGLVSQRVLFGNSLEEVTATDEDRLSSFYHWSWYDELSPGFRDWVLVANPSDTETVSATISFTNKLDGQPVTQTFNIGPGKNVIPEFPGKMGGPVEVRAFIYGGSWSNSTDRRPVIASQRVTTDNGTAFNEVPGIADEELSSHYYWTWYDEASEGAKNWVLIANPSASAAEYEVLINGQTATTGVVEAHGSATPTFPGTMGGPVEVRAYQPGGDWANPDDRVDVIASQRAIWGPSFEEVPGYPENVPEDIATGRPAVGLSADYQWTWYDNLSSGSKNWVVIANLGAEPATAEVYVGGTLRGVYQMTAAGTVGAMKPVQYGGLMGGPVEVRAYRQGGSWSEAADRCGASDADPCKVFASQRVLWSGFFNEVQGTVLALD